MLYSDVYIKEPIDKIAEDWDLARAVIACLGHADHTRAASARYRPLRSLTPTESAPRLERVDVRQVSRQAAETPALVAAAPDFARRRSQVEPHRIAQVG